MSAFVFVSHILDTLVRTVADSSKPMELSELFATWSKCVPVDERKALMGEVEPMPPVIASAGIAELVSSVAERRGTQPPPLPTLQVETAAIQTVAAPIQPVVAEVAPPAPRKPSVWEAHIQPFFVENWYIVAGIAMVILGSSLLAYYTWDKHWLVRYTLMPLLLGAFTSLAGVAAAAGGGTGVGIRAWRTDLCEAKPGSSDFFKQPES